MTVVTKMLELSYALLASAEELELKVHSLRA